MWVTMWRKPKLIPSILKGYGICKLRSLKNTVSFKKEHKWRKWDSGQGQRVFKNGAQGFLVASRNWSPTSGGGDGETDGMSLIPAETSN